MFSKCNQEVKKEGKYILYAVHVFSAINYSSSFIFKYIIIQLDAHSRAHTTRTNACARIRTFTDVNVSGNRNHDIYIYLRSRAQWRPTNYNEHKANSYM